MAPPCPLLLRLFRYAVDDLRLYQVRQAECRARSCSLLNLWASARQASP